MKELEKIYKLSEVLAAAEEFPWDSDLFVDRERNWNSDSDCAVIRIDKDDLDPMDEEAAEHPEFAKLNNLIYGLTMADVQDIVSNARVQDPNINQETLVRAFVYYHEKDAFVEVSKLDKT